MIRPAPSLILVVLALCQTPSLRAAEKPKNTLFDELRDNGVAVTPEMSVPVPAPLMADGLDASAQREVLKAIVGRRFTVDDFIAKGGTAPHVYQVRKVPTADAAIRVYAVDVSFIAHGRLNTIADRNFLEDLHRQQKDRKIHILSAEELDKRGLRVESDRGRDERYSHGVFVVLDRVEVSAALHTVVTRQPDSLLAATWVDPRFAKDADFANQWRKIQIDDEGRRKLGPPQPYRGAGGYLKITRLMEPKGALLIEYHLVYAEPNGWFGGADPLTAKLPAIIQSEVRTFRQELNKVKK